MSAAPKGSAAFWDERYADEPERYGEAPNAYLEATAADLPRGRAFLPADGQGRNGLWLAGEGFDVTTIDLSAVAVARAREKAAALGRTIHAAAGDVLDAPPEEAAYDLVAVIFFHVPTVMRQKVHAVCARALRPGGHLIIEGFSPRHLSLPEDGRSAGPTNPDVTFSPDALRTEFAGLEATICVEADVILTEGRRHHGRALVTRGHFRRPHELR